MSNTKISKKIKILVDGKVVGEVDHFNISETRDIKPIYDVGIDEPIKTYVGESTTRIEFPPIDTANIAIKRLPAPQVSAAFWDGYCQGLPEIYIDNCYSKEHNAFTNYAFTNYPLTGFTKIVGTDKYPIPAPKKSPPYRCKKIKDTGPTLPKIDPKVIMEELGAEEQVMTAKIQPITTHEIVLGPEFYIDHGDCQDFPEPPPAKRDPGPGKLVSPKSKSLWKKIKKLWI